MNTLTFAGWLADAPAWIAGVPEGLQRFLFQLFQCFVYGDRWKMYVSGLKITFIVTLGALALGIVIGMILAVIRTSYDSYSVIRPPLLLRVLDPIVKLYLTVIRGTPMMVQLLIMGFVIMIPKTQSACVACGIITLGVNSGAYVAEIIRSGLQSIPKGQTEAGRSLGFNFFQTMWYIVIPQAVKNILPALGNEMITLLKDTSLVAVIALRDVTKQAQNIVSVTYNAFVPYITLALIYLVLVIILTKLLSLLEKRLKKSDH
ncbi:MAG: amino acid ABC transporter permease [Clostridia bacterium]|nr:amino acid ABC transporter permease [Clostridia bacterium]